MLHVQQSSQSGAAPCLAALVLILVTAGCTGAAAPFALEPAEPAESTPPQPVTELSADLLYDLLLAGIAAQRGVTEVELDALSRAAFKSADPRLLAYAAYSALRAGDYARALVNGRRWQRRQPQEAEPLELIGNVLLVGERFREAGEVFGELLGRASAGERDMRIRRVVEIFSETGITPPKFELYKRLIKEYKYNATAHYGAAFLAMRLNDEAGAERSMKRVLRLRPRWSDAALTWMEYLYAHRRMDEAIAFGGAFVRRNRGDTLFEMNYAGYLQLHGRRLEALKHFSRIAKREPLNLDAHYAAAVINQRIGRNEPAREHLQQVLAIDPERDDARYDLADLEYESRRFDEAGRLVRLITDDAYYLDAQFLLGAVIAGKRGADTGLAFLRALRVRDEARVRWYIVQSGVLNEERRYHEARDLLTHALGEFPDDGDLLYARALTASHLKEIDLLERDLRQLIRQEPGNPHAYNAFGYTLADITDRYHEALALIEKAVSLRGDDPHILDSMGWVQYRLGNIEMALEFLRKALDISPDAEIAAHLGEVLWVSGRERRAHALWRRMLKLYPDNRVLRRTVERFGL